MSFGFKSRYYDAELIWTAVIADAVTWLFSDRSSYYTGQSLTLDGGLTAQRPYVTKYGSEKGAALEAERMCAKPDEQLNRKVCT
jgi:hypothetical protein